MKKGGGNEAREGKGNGWRSKTKPKIRARNCCKNL